MKYAYVKDIVVNVVEELKVIIKWRYCTSQCHEGYGLQKNEILQFPLSLKKFVCPKKKGYYTSYYINNYCILNKARPQQKYVQCDKGWNSFELRYL